MHEALASVGLTPVEAFISKFPHTLSGGQRQRVGIARALVMGPDYVVADEPVSMIDASSRAEILYLMRDLQRQYGNAFLYITHDIASAAHFSDRVAVMYLGRIVEIGPPGAVIGEPLHPTPRRSSPPSPSPTPPTPPPARRRARRAALAFEHPAGLRLPSPLPARHARRLRDPRPRACRGEAGPFRLLLPLRAGRRLTSLAVAGVGQRGYSGPAASESMQARRAVLPFDNIKVIDLTTRAPGPFCSMALADMGAEVVMVEAPAGVGSQGGPGTDEVREAAFDPLRRNKRSIVLDLKDAGARQALYDLAAGADVFMEGFKPGTVKRLGADYETLRGVNERLVYCSLSGYGQTAPTARCRATT